MLTYAQYLEEERLDEGVKDWARAVVLAAAILGGSVSAHAATQEKIDPITVAAAMLPAEMQANAPTIIKLGQDYSKEQWNNVRQNYKRTPSKAQAYVKWDGDDHGNTVYVKTWSDDYLKAQKGDKDALIQIAGTLAHEFTHIHQGKSEKVAYEVQLKVLRQLGAKPSFIKMIEKSRDYVADQEAKFGTAAK